MRNVLVVVVVAVLSLGTVDAFAGANEDLMTAVKAGQLEGVEKALGAGANVNAFNADGFTAITGAYFWPEITKLLLSKGANPNLGPGSAVTGAAANYSTESLKLLLDAGADPNKPTVVSSADGIRKMVAAERAKGKAANQGNIKAWEALLNSPAVKNAKPVEYFPLRHAVYATSCVPCVEMLLAKGAKLDLGITDGTLMHLFADGIWPSKEHWKTNFAAVKTSLETLGMTLPAWYAATLPEDRIGTADQMVKVLMAKGLGINQPNKGLNGTKPQTPLELTLTQGLGKRKDVMLALIANGADVKIVNPAYGPVILQAVSCGFVEVVQAMVEKGADVNTRGTVFTNASDSSLSNSFTPLTTAALKNNLEIVKYLIGAGANAALVVNGRSNMKLRNANPTFGNDSITCLVDARDKSALFFAVENDNLEMVKFLIENKAYDQRPYTLTAVHSGPVGYGAGCIGGGTYTPSKYAVVTHASPSVVELLKSQGL